MAVYLSKRRGRVGAGADQSGFIWVHIGSEDRAAITAIFFAVIKSLVALFEPLDGLA